MKLQKFKKTSSERMRITVNYAQWLVADEVLEDVTFEVTETTSPALTIEDDTLIVNDTVSRFFIDGGASGTQYTVLILATTSDGQIREDYVIVTVQDVAE